MKTFKDQVSEAKKFEIRVELGSARKAQEALNDELRGTYKQDGSDVFVFKREDDAYAALYTFKRWEVEVRDSDIEDWEEIMDESVNESEEYSFSGITSTTSKVNVPYLDIVVKDSDGKEAYPIRIHHDMMKYNSKVVKQITDILKNSKIKL